jgi:hypothetical protein
MSSHRAGERSLFERLQATEHGEARELLESLLGDADKTYDEICGALKRSGLFADLKAVTPQDLTRYRQRKAREESRATVLSLIESEPETLLNAAAKNPTGVIARYLRARLTEEAVARFDAEVGDVDVVDLSRELGRHARVEQNDRKLDLVAEKLELDRRKVELDERKAELDRDKLKIAAGVWTYLLTWAAKEEPVAADALTKRSEEIVSGMEEYVAAQ